MLIWRYPSTLNRNLPTERQTNDIEISGIDIWVFVVQPDNIYESRLYFVQCF